MPTTISIPATISISVLSHHRHPCPHLHLSRHLHSSQHLHPSHNLRPVLLDSKGREMREGIEKTLEKLQEPSKRKEKKALPAPIEKARKKRGGRRHRKMKERFEVTELSKFQNRMVCGPKMYGIERW